MTLQRESTGRSSGKRAGLVAVLAVALMLVASLGIVAGGCGGGDLPSAGGGTTTSDGTGTTAAGDLSASLNGAGATFPKPLYIEWIGEFQMINPDVKINYQGIGSGGGIEQFTKMTVDFGASDAL
jgi:phosphate transport system substrate-binding protein